MRQPVRSKPSGSKSPLKVPFGLLNNVLVEPGNVPNGNACGCICPFCKEPLVAHNRGQVRVTPHFAHRPGVDCPHAVESAIHLAGKRALLEAKRFRRPLLTVDANGIVVSTSVVPGWMPWMPLDDNQYMVEHEAAAEYLTVDEEKSIDVTELQKTPESTQLALFSPNPVPAAESPTVHRLRPDIKAVHSKYTDWIEICVSHPVPPEKKALMAADGMRVIEVNLAHFLSGPVSLADVFHDVIERLDNKTWLAHPKVEPMRAYASARS